MNDHVWRQLEPHAHQTDEEVERYLLTVDTATDSSILRRRGSLVSPTLA